MRFGRKRLQSKRSADRYALAYPERRLLSNARYRAKELGVPFDIEESDILIPEVCPIFGTRFQTGTPYAQSLDRIIPELGYVKGNVQVISRRANLMKQDASQEELKKFAKWINQSIN